VTDLLGALAAITDDLRPWCELIEDCTGPAADAGFVRFMVESAADLVAGYEPRWRWRPDAAAELLSDWVRSDRVRGRVAGFLHEHPQCKNAADALRAIESLDAGDEGLWLCWDGERLPVL
jgi:hypothetical protein